MIRGWIPCWQHWARRACCVFGAWNGCFFSKHVFPSSPCILAVVSCDRLCLYERPGSCPGVWCCLISSNSFGVASVSPLLFFFFWWLALVFACWDLSVIDKEAIVWWLVQQFTYFEPVCSNNCGNVLYFLMHFTDNQSKKCLIHSYGGRFPLNLFVSLVMFECSLFWGWGLVLTPVLAHLKLCNAPIN